MHESNEAAVRIPAPGVPGSARALGRDVLTEILREGAQRMLAQAIDAEVAEWIDRHADLVDQEGRRQVVRNGHHPARTILTGVGPIAVEQPRVHDRRIVGRRAVELSPGRTPDATAAGQTPDTDAAGRTPDADAAGPTVWQDVDADGRPVERFRSAILPPYLPGASRKRCRHWSARRRPG